MLTARAAERLQSIQLVDISRGRARSRPVAASRRLRVGPVVAHPATYEDGPDAGWRGAPRRGACWCCSSDRTSATSIRGRRASCSRASAARFGDGDALLLGTDLVKPDASCCWPTTTRSGDGGVQPEPAAAHQPELGATFDLDASAHGAVWNATDRRGDASGQPARRNRCGSRRPICTSASRRASRSGPRAPINTGRNGCSTWGARPVSAMREQWIDESAHFALTRFSPTRRPGRHDTEAPRHGGFLKFGVSVPLCGEGTKPPPEGDRVPR